MKWWDKLETEGVPPAGGTIESLVLGSEHGTLNRPARSRTLSSLASVIPTVGTVGYPQPSRHTAGLDVKLVEVAFQERTPRFRFDCMHKNKMKRITFSADENLIQRARLIAHRQGKTLNQAIREWLMGYATGAGNAHEFDALMIRLQHVKAGRHFTRDEMNER